MPLFYIIFQAYFILIFAYDKGSHNVDVQVESYKYGDYYFNFYYVEANWDEACAICKATYSRLAVVHTVERANFLAETLSRTIFGVEDVWIGGRFLADNWQWISIKRSLPSQIINGFPPWLNYPTKRGKYCMSLDRTNHSKPIFVELQCSLQRPFICEKSSIAHLTVKPTLSSNIKINSTMYSVYYGRVTWDEALTFCKQIGTRLATVRNIESATQLVRIMQHLRPAIRNAWIGARKHNYNWIWTSIDEVLPNEKNLDTEFPPWANDYYNSDLMYKDCLALDHHVCKRLNLQGDRGVRPNCQEKSIFLPESCSLKKDFICESLPSKKRKFSNETEVVIVGSIKYIYSRQRLPWRSAVQICKSLKMILAMPVSQSELDTIVSNLADVEFAWDHIWLGAKWDVLNNRWEWLNDTAIALPSSEVNYLPWCNTMPVHEDYENCLNLDRDAHNVPVVYGFNCSIPQGFVCQFIPQEGTPLPESSEIHTFMVNNYLLNYADAEEACQVSKSHLAITNTFKLAQNLSSILPLDTLVWLGGERIDSVWQWTRTKEVIPDFTDDINYPPWGIATTTEGKMCLAMQSGFRKYPQFMEMPCSSKLPYVCEIGEDSNVEADVIIEHDDNMYYFFKKKYPWDKADFICTISHLRLPTIGNLELANFLSGIVGDEHDWWVGGKRDSRDWQWTTTGEKISEKIRSAPWFSVANSSESDNFNECLLLINDTDSRRVIGESCDAEHEFICVSYNVGADEHLTKKLNGMIVDVIQQQSNYANGKEYCKEQGMNVLDPLKDIQITKELMKEKKMQSVWMNIIRTESGKWAYENLDKEFSADIKFPDKTKTYPEDKKLDCAMLVFRLSEQPEIRRSDCNDFSYIICQKVSKQRVSTIVFEEMEMNITDKIKFIANIKNRTYVQAKSFCKGLGANVVDSSLYVDAVRFFQTLSAGYKAFWISEIVTGELDKVTFSDVWSSKLEPSCVAFNRTENEWHNANCNDKVSTMCYMELNLCQALPLVENLKWSPRICEQGDVESGKVCTATCLKGTLFGPQKIVCVRGIWVFRSHLLNISHTTPLCLDNTKQSQFLLKYLTSPEITESKPKPPLLFALDAGVSEFLFEITISIVKHIVNVILLNQHRKAAVMLYSKQAHTVLEWNEYNTCDFTEKLKFLSMFEHSSQPDYLNTLLNVEKMLDESRFKKLFMFLFALRKDTASILERNEVIKRLQKRNVTITVLAVALDRATVEGLASLHNNEVQLYWFKNTKVFRNCGNFLQQHKNFAVDSCALQKVARAEKNLIGK